MSLVEMGQTQADHPGADRDIPQTRNEQVQRLRDGTKARQRTAIGLTRTAVSGPRGVLGAASTAQRPHDGAHDGNRERTVRVREYLVCQSQVQNYIRHADRSTETSVSVPDAEAENAKHDRSHAQAVCQSKKRCGRESEQLISTVTQQTRQRGSSFQQQYRVNSGAGQSRKPRAASEL